MIAHGSHGTKQRHGQISVSFAMEAGDVGDSEYGRTVGTVSYKR